MTADAAPIAIPKRADRRRLQDRMRELDELAGLMKERGYLPPAPEPVPLHRRRANADREGDR